MLTPHGHTPQQSRLLSLRGHKFSPGVSDGQHGHIQLSVSRSEVYCLSAYFLSVF